MLLKQYPVTVIVTCWDTVLLGERRLGLVVTVTVTVTVYVFWQRILIVHAPALDVAKL
jgi:hypothetical protein